MPDPIGISTRHAGGLGRTPLNKQQIIGFWAAWAGWLLDGMDLVIYALVLGPALTELLPRSGIEITPGNVGFAGSILFALFLAGWGMSFIWGPIGDRFGGPGHSPAERFSSTLSSPVLPLCHKMFMNSRSSAFWPGSAWAANGRWPAPTLPKPGPRIGARWAPDTCKAVTTLAFSSPTPLMQQSAPLWAGVRCSCAA